MRNGEGESGRQEQNEKLNKKKMKYFNLEIKKEPFFVRVIVEVQ